MQTDHPAPVSAWLAADAAGDPEALARSFAPEGAVLDEGAVHRGQEAIRAWWRAAKAKYRHRMIPLTIATENGRTIVTGRVSGDFPGSPATLRFAFDVGADGIQRLEIGA